MTRSAQLRLEIERAAAVLAEAGVGSPRADAEELAAYAAGTSRGRLALVGEVDDEFYGRFADLVAARSQRIPLQHIVGTAVLGPVTVEVGPGVFIPRPETESMLEWACALPLPKRPRIVDLCTGSAAFALALSRHWPDARVIAVDDSDDALAYARRNVAGTRVELLCADVTDPALLPELDGQVDLVVANPPYVADSEILEPEVTQHDPPHAVFGGPDGMTIVRAIVRLASRWLRAGGQCAVEHDDTRSAEAVEAFTDAGRFVDVTARRDLAGRPRFVTATRAGVEA
jgi:release factor glutamine methyltransferase